MVLHFLNAVSCALVKGSLALLPADPRIHLTPFNHQITGPLGMENKLLGYVFLIDSNLKIRWAGCGTAQPKETDDLRRATAVLMARMGQEQEGMS